MGYSVNIKQHDISDCGVASLASVAAHYGLRYPLSRLRVYSGTNTDGTTIGGLLSAAARIGLTARGFKGKISSLYKIPKPAILHLKRLDGILHFVVLYKISGKNVHIMDPAEGRINRVKIEEFNKEWTGYLIVAEPDQTFKQGRVGISPLNRLAGIFRKSSRQYLRALGLSLLYILISLSTSLFLKYLIDTVIPSGDPLMLRRVSLVMLMLTMISFILYYYRSKLLLALSVGTNRDLISAYLEKLFTLPHNFFESRRTGEVTSRVDDAFKVGSMMSDVAINVAISILTLLLSFILLFTIHWRLSLLVLTFTPLYVALYWIYDRINRTMRRRIMEEGAQFESSLIEGVKSARSVKYFGIEKHTIEKIRGRLSILNDSLLKAGSWGITLSGVTDVSSRLLSLATLWVGGLFILSQTLTLGELLSFYTLTALFSSPLTSLIGLNASLREGYAASERLFEVMELEGEQYHDGVLPEISSTKELRLEHISFGYTGRESLLKDLSMTLESGKINALCGKSGSGKSTIASLIMRILQVENGIITIDGININHINLVLWREWVTIVPQNPELFAGTLTENIAPGEGDPDFELIMDLCRELGLLEFIGTLPMGFETRLGEGGSSLSRGQQQRIAIVRALYRRPRILILDEATSSLDNLSTELIEKSIVKERNQGTIILLITHNDENLKIADKVVTI